MSPVRVAVVGHAEWVTHARGTLPRAGEITHLDDPLDEAGGGGGVAATQIAALGADCRFLTALGDDDLGRGTAAALRAAGVTVEVAWRRTPQTRALSVTADDGDRAIAVVGTRLHPEAGDPLPWDDLATMDAVYFTGRDPATLAACRRAPVLVVMARRWPVLAESGVGCDVLVGSADDPGETPPYGALRPAPDVVVATQGARGGWVRPVESGAWRYDATPPPGPAVDSYGCGDAFAGGLTTGLAAGWSLERAIALAAGCGASAVTARGGLAGVLRAARPEDATPGGA